MSERVDVAAVMAEAITQALREKGMAAVAINAETPVDSRLGLDSLDWAAVVVGLEARLGVDPFTEGVDMELRNVGDLVALYEKALS